MCLDLALHGEKCLSLSARGDHAIAELRQGVDDIASRPLEHDSVLDLLGRAAELVRQGRNFLRFETEDRRVGGVQRSLDENVVENFVVLLDDGQRDDDLSTRTLSGRRRRW